MSLIVLGHNIQGLIAAGLAAQGGTPVTVLKFHNDDDGAPVTHVPYALPKHLIETLGLENHGFVKPAEVVNPFQALPFYDGLKILLNMMETLDVNRPPYQEKAWRDTWATFEVGHVLSNYGADIQDLFARAATLSLVEMLSAADLKDTDKESILQACLCGSKTDPNAKGSACAILPAMAPYEHDNAIVITGSLENLTTALEGAAMGFGADIITEKTVRKITTDGQSIHSIIMNDESEYSGDLIILDHNPVDLFQKNMTDYDPSPAFMNRIRPNANAKYGVLAHVELSGDIANHFDNTSISSVQAFQDFKADGGSQYPTLSIIPVKDGHSLEILAQYFEPDLGNDDAVIQAIKQSLNKTSPNLSDKIETIKIVPLPSHAGQPNFLGGLPFLQLLKFFSGHHAVAYDLPLSNAVMAGYGAGTCAHPQIINGGERAAALYQSL